MALVFATIDPLPSVYVHEIDLFASTLNVTDRGPQGWFAVNQQGQAISMINSSVGCEFLSFSTWNDGANLTWSNGYPNISGSSTISYRFTSSGYAGTCLYSSSSSSTTILTILMSGGKIRFRQDGTVTEIDLDSHNWFAVSTRVAKHQTVFIELWPQWDGSYLKAIFIE